MRRLILPGLYIGTDSMNTGALLALHNRLRVVLTWHRCFLPVLPCPPSEYTYGFRALDLHRAFGFQRLYKLVSKGIYLVCPIPVHLQFRKADGVCRRFFR